MIKFSELYASRRAQGASDWMCTFSGVKYYPANPRVEDVRIIDIAHAESMLCRYTGHSRVFYSVAEHSIHVSYLVPPEYALEGLMHDATEAYVNDLSRPLKRSCPDYQRIEALNWSVIARKFNLSIALPPCVKDADNAVLKPEREALMPRMTPDQEACWPQSDLDTSGITILALSPASAEIMFLLRFHDLMRGRDSAAKCYPDPRRPLITDGAMAPGPA